MCFWWKGTVRLGLHASLLKIKSPSQAPGDHECSFLLGDYFLRHFGSTNEVMKLKAQIFPHN